MDLGLVAYTSRAGTLTRQTFLDGFRKVFGNHPGFRKNHAKGVSVVGHFMSNGNAAALSRAAVFGPGETPVAGRFSLAGGNPDVNAAAVRDLRAHLDALTESPEHRALADDATEAAALMDAVEYTVRIKKSDVRVGRYHGEPDYGAEVAAVFDRFRVDGAARRAEDVPVRPGLDGVEAAILTDVTALFPDTFRALARFRERHAGAGDPVVARADLEIDALDGMDGTVDRLEVDRHVADGQQRGRPRGACLERHPPILPPRAPMRTRLRAPVTHS